MNTKRTPESKKPRIVPSWIGATLTVGTFAVLVVLERRRPLRSTQVESKFVRNVRNLTVASAALIITSVVERPFALRLARRVERRRQGLLAQLELPRALETTLAVLLLDYTLYIWHYQTHRIPALWRIHLVHHVDLDMDASTGIRFHAAELLISVLFRLAQIRIIGVSPLAFTAWQTLLLPSVLFHHSNVELPIAWERKLSRVIVTPRLHETHHSIRREETDSNWSSGLTVWDWLHGTLRRDATQDTPINTAVTTVIGVPAFRTPDDVTLEKIAALPFVEQPDSWQFPETTSLSTKH
ncbi:MAG: sterol desaturase family protein [Pyrinomonadaceae bacterium MAG19_C2-C3]|nr:sterol desaturase family protein [Pyrinomonadaceae bacterium MAG19_C2-C3]